MKDQEEWRPWREGNYEVSNLGQVRRARPGKRTHVGRLMKPVLMKIGYLGVGPTVNGRNITTLVHLMVAECFLGPRPEGKEVNHIDGNKANPRASNLEYVSHIENAAHAKRLGLLPLGECHPNAKLSDAQVDELRYRRSIGAGVCALAREFKVSPATVSEIVNNKKRIG